MLQRAYHCRDVCQKRPVACSRLQLALNVQFCEGLVPEDDTHWHKLITDQDPEITQQINIWSHYLDTRAVVRQIELKKTKIGQPQNLKKSQSVLIRLEIS